jgi:hypothetical protein
MATATLLLLAAVPTEAPAAGPGGNVTIINNNYVSNNNQNVGPSAHRGGYGYGYGYRPSYRSFGRGRGFESHDAAVARIKATHSRFRQSYHPRSYYNSPPHYYDWRGW